MKNVKNDKQKQITDIVSVVKLSSLLLIGIILCKEFIKKDGTVIWDSQYYYTLTCIFIPLMIISLIYFVWIFSTKNRSYNRYGKIPSKFEICLFIIVFTIIIFVCGANESQYKILYLFIIITTTIQS